MFSVFYKQVQKVLCISFICSTFKSCGTAYSEVINCNYSIICFQPHFYSSLLSSELPSLLPIVDVAEALLHVRNGDWFLCLLVANVPDSFNEGSTFVQSRQQSFVA